MISVLERPGLDTEPIAFTPNPLPSSRRRKEGENPSCSSLCYQPEAHLLPQHEEGDVERERHRRAEDEAAGVEAPDGVYLHPSIEAARTHTHTHTHTRMNEQSVDTGGSPLQHLSLKRSSMHTARTRVVAGLQAASSRYVGGPALLCQVVNLRNKASGLVGTLYACRRSTADEDFARWRMTRNSGSTESAASVATTVQDLSNQRTDIYPRSAPSQIWTYTAHRHTHDSDSSGS